LAGLVSPILLYSVCVLGALGVTLALPRRGVSPQVVGALIVALALGVLFIGLGVAGRNSGWALGGLPNVNFYLFSVIGLGAGLRMISHPRPVYAALYFILTILASAGLFVLLSAEFMAFALVIVYAGAILITYLFVIMLATESPTADQVEALSEYDRYAREPGLAAVVGFVFVACMTTMMATGVGDIPRPDGYAGSRDLGALPRKVETALRSAGVIDRDERVAVDGGKALIDLTAVAPAERRGDGPRVAGTVTVEGPGGMRHVVTPADPRWPSDLELTNVEGVGFALLRDHPGSIEVAGVILLMAMLGAVVLARKKVELDEAVKLEAERRSLATVLTPEGSPLMGPDPASLGPTFREAATTVSAAGGGVVGVEIKPATTDKTAVGANGTRGRAGGGA
jgi:NADH-quinone oxidoreductase subunit J